MEIRPAVVTDLPHLVALWQERMVLLSQSDPRFGRIRIAPAAWKASAEARLSDPCGAVFVAITDLGYAGYISGYFRTEMALAIIDEIALDAHSYHAGAGRSLVKAIRLWFEQHPIDRILVQVPRYHAVEQAFWRALGAGLSAEAPCKTLPEFNWMIL